MRASVKASMSSGEKRPIMPMPPPIAAHAAAHSRAAAEVAPAVAARELVAHRAAAELAAPVLRRGGRRERGRGGEDDHHAFHGRGSCGRKSDDAATGCAWRDYGRVAQR